MPMRTSQVDRKLCLKTCLAISAVAIWTLATAGSAVALGIGESGNYSKQNGCPSGGNSIDPVGVVFHGSKGHAHGAASAVEHHAGWSVTIGGSQGLNDHQGNGNYTCRGTDHQRASGHLSRFHVRLWFVDASQGKPVQKSVGTPHHEDWVWTCPSHAVDSNGPTGSGFDWGRRKLSQEMFDGGHTGQQNEWWGNTANFKQCDGDYAGSSGTGVLIPVNHGH